MKKLSVRGLALFAAMVALFAFAGCGPATGEDSGDRPERPEITYTVPTASEPPAEIDYTGYTTYYFDGEGGNDSNSGLKELAPKRTLTALTQLAREASEENPMRFLLRRGSEFSGLLQLTDYEVSEEKPLVIGAYGDEEDGMPVLTGAGNNTDTAYAVILVTQSNTRIYDLEITDPYAYQGIYVNTVRAGALENVVIENCFVHDVNFFWDDRFDPNNPPSDPDDLDSICPEANSTGAGYGRAYYRNYGGIIFYNNTSTNVGASWFENVYVRNCTIERVARTGIYMATRWSNAPGVGYGNNKFVDGSDKTDEYNDVKNGIGYFMHKNVNFVGNRLDLIGGDGIILAGKDSFLEGNTCYRANYLGRTGRPVGTNAAYQYFNAAVWVFDSDNVVFQNNEAAYTFLRNGAGDGEGFDIDNSCVNILFQYNYAHHNEGGGLLLCNNTAGLLRYDAQGNVVSPNGQPEQLLGEWGNNYVRNNVFAHNGLASDPSRSAFLTLARKVDDLHCYNNTVILGEIAEQRIINIEDVQAIDGHYYANNLFFSAEPASARMNIGLLNSPVFEHNLYYNLSGADSETGETPVTLDPQIVLPDSYDGRQTLASFAGGESRLYSLGVLVNGALTKDILGTAAEGIAYIGAFAGNKV